MIEEVNEDGSATVEKSSSRESEGSVVTGNVSLAFSGCYIALRMRLISLIHCLLLTR